MTNRRRVGLARPFAFGVAVVMVPALFAVLALATFARQSFAANPAGSPRATETPPPNALPPNPAVDARVTTYIQKRFMISDPSHIQLGPVIPTLMKGVYSRTLRVSNDRGQAVSATIYTNATADQMILTQGLGQIYDLTKDPWEKIDGRISASPLAPTGGRFAPIIGQPLPDGGKSF